MPAPRRVAACVLTGFLGSGKTTLLRALLDADPGRERIAVVVNEIGEVGIDGRVLTGFEYVENVVELASGCVCCSIDEYRFDLAVEELLRRLDPTLLVLETTGLADPAPTVERLRRAGLGVDAVVTVVDASAWATAWRMSGAARRQVEAADFLVVSKCDLVTARSLARLRARLASRNPRATVLESGRDRPLVGADLLLATSAAAVARQARAALPSPPDPQSQPEPQAPPVSQAPPGLQAPPGPVDASASGHLQEDGIESFSLRSVDPVDHVAFERFLRGLPREVVRAKGFLVPAAGGPCLLFQVVCGRVEFSGFEGTAPTGFGLQAVFLGRGVRALGAGLGEGVRACSRPRAAATAP